MAGTMQGERTLVFYPLSRVARNLFLTAEILDLMCLRTHGQITTFLLSDGCGGDTIPMTANTGYCRSRFEGYQGKVGLEVIN